MRYSLCLRSEVPPTILPLIARLAALILLISVSSLPSPSQVSVSISPAVVTAATLATQQFKATITGTANTQVTWEVSGVVGGDSTVGLISTAGLYLSPSVVPSPDVVSVTAVSQADPTKSASATVTLQVPSRSGVTYYVATTGKNSNPGTLNAPWRTIQYAANSVHPGDTVEVEGGVYNEIVTIPSSGNSSSGYITFMSYPGETAIVDGTGLKVGSSGQTGLFNLEGAHSYIIIDGFEVRNFRSSISGQVPVGIDFEGAGSYVEILNNHIHNIAQTGTTCDGANALGMAIYGDQAPASINNLTLSGNEVDHNTTGCSENVSLNGNVQYFVEANNLVHDGDNIGLDDIGFEQVSPIVAYDQARDGWVFQNTIYNISSSVNPVYGYSLGADGYYCDGCTRIIVERNLIHDTDVAIELASEQPGHVGSHDIARNNVIYRSLLTGISIGGADPNQNGGTDHCTIVDNTLWDDDTHNTGSGEFQIQFHATNNIFGNNILYANTQGLLINDFTASEPNPVVLDYNLYYSKVGAASSTWTWQGKSITGFSAYKTVSHMDAHSGFADPQFLSLGTPPNLDIKPTSPAENAGFNMGSSVVGILDYAGNPRVNAKGQVNIGAYEQ